MTVRPIDMQIAIQKSDQYVKEFNHNSQINNNQHGITLETKKEAVQNQRQVIATEASDNSRIEKDGSSKSRDNDREQKNSEKNQVKDRNIRTELTENGKGNFIDLII